MGLDQICENQGGSCCGLADTIKGPEGLLLCEYVGVS